MSPRETATPRKRTGKAKTVPARTETGSGRTLRLVAFLKGVNVGGNKTFQPAALARELAAFGLVNVGAAGTFVALKAPSIAALRAALLEKLPFEAEVAIVPAKQLLALMDSEPFPASPPGDVRRLLTVLTREPKTRPRLPIRRPDGTDWQMQVLAAAGPFVLSFWRPSPRLLAMDVVEREFGVPATARTWNTIEKIRAILARA